MESGSTNEQSLATQQEPIANATQPTDFKVWRPPRGSSTSRIATNNLPDSYFEPTTGEIMALQQSRTAARERLVDAPLRTAMIREREEKQKESKYPTTTIRVKFPDQTQLERVFPSTDKIRSVYAFVRNSLREDVKPIKFVLYQTPPRRELKVSDLAVRDKTLYQLQLAPSSVLMLSFLDESLNHKDVPAPLSEAVLALAEDLPLPPVFNETPPSEPASSSVGGSIAALAEKKIPKWLKVGSRYS
ncbi:hypothetical protein PIIN_02749 [Serendipita indica DSM 11827]|uniref:UBX domain-containing protein n=1 Tax=Serendipita indica (strain DSM 11827) TaxID=1109443 RepID=G4TC59_SERID|nr:hypothetical protein PIIN_02749 [Serendipita indica DSM 11827]